MTFNNTFDKARRVMENYLADNRDADHGDYHQDFKRLWHQYLKPHRKAFLAAAVFTSIATSAPMLFAFAWRWLIDHVLMQGRQLTPRETHDGVRGVLIFVGVNLAIWIVHLVCIWMRGRLIHATSRDLVYSLRRDLHEKLAALHIGYFERMPTGRIMSRIMDDVKVIQQTATMLLVMIFAAGARLFIAPLLLCLIDWRLALLCTVFLPFYALTYGHIKPKLKKAHMAMRRINSRMYGLVAERVGGIKVVQTFGRETAERRGLARMVNEWIRVAMWHITWQQTLSLLVRIVTSGATALIIYIMAVRVKSGAMTLGDMIAFVGVMSHLFNPIRELLGYLMQAQATQVVFRRVLALLDEPVEVPSGRVCLRNICGEVKLDDVLFQYPSQVRPALDELNLKVEPGEKVALMGPSGSGKTTVFQLLMRFYDPQRGEVRISGVNLAEADISTLRTRLGLVQQEPIVFSGTIADNIRYGRPDASDKEIERAAEAAELHEFVMNLPDRYNTVLGESGVTLSGGERQRLALATALLTEPEIMLLDDITSALDSATEARIRATLLRVLKSKTGIIITQRVTTARECDRILILEQGHITQEGDHESLSNVQGFYQRVRKQQEV